MIPVSKYAAWRTISYPAMTRQGFRRMCRNLAKEIPEYYDGIAGEREIVIRVTKYVPQKEEYIEEAQRRNVNIADAIIARLKELEKI